MKNGQFARIASYCFIMSGQPSCFSSLITYSQGPTAHTSKGELLEHFGKIEKGEPIEELSFDQLLSFDYGTELERVKEFHGFHKYNGLPTTAFLLDLITLFVGSRLARYDVLGWKKILDGEDNPYRIHFEDTFERFQSFIIDSLLLELDEPFSGFGKSIIPSQISPYSHRHLRFKK